MLSICSITVRSSVAFHCALMRPLKMSSPPVRLPVPLPVWPVTPGMVNGAAVPPKKLAVLIGP
jgi:hypothetical protein